jgi:hypothetical protein
LSLLLLLLQRAYSAPLSWLKSGQVLQEVGTRENEARKREGK